MSELPGSTLASCVDPGLPPTPQVDVGGASAVGSAAEPLTSAVGPSIGPDPTGGLSDDLDLHNVPPELNEEGCDWSVIFNPTVKRSLDINLLHTFKHESVVCTARFSPDGKYLATGCHKTAQIFDIETGQRIRVFTHESAGQSREMFVRCVRFSPDGKFLATAAEDKLIRVWETSNRLWNILHGHRQEVYSVDFAPNGRLLVSGSGDGTVRIWDINTGLMKVLTINENDSAKPDYCVTSVAVSPNGLFIAAATLDKLVRIWDFATGSLVECLQGHQDSVYSIAFMPDGNGLVSGSLDKTLKYWDVSVLISGGINEQKEGTSNLNAPGAGPNGRNEIETTSRCIMNSTGHQDFVLSVAVSHDARWVVSGSKDRSVRFWDSSSAIVQCMLQGHSNSIISLDLSPTGNVLATVSGDMRARIWHYTTTAV